VDSMSADVTQALDAAVDRISARRLVSLAELQ
jgi:hypothetical protein